jgi:hypothetical protein
VVGQVRSLALHKTVAETIRVAPRKVVGQTVNNDAAAISWNQVCDQLEARGGEPKSARLIVAGTLDLGLVTTLASSQPWRVGFGLFATRRVTSRRIS